MYINNFSSWSYNNKKLPFDIKTTSYYYILKSKLNFHREKEKKLTTPNKGYTYAMEFTQNTKQSSLKNAAVIF